MPLRPYRYEDPGGGGEVPLPPATPPSPPGTPAGGPGTPPGTPPPIGGGGGGGGFLMPSLPNFNQIPGAPGFTAPQFRAPDAASLYSDPGYQARLDASQKALERSAAARGALRTGGTLNDVMELGQNFASQEYAGAYQRALAAHEAATRAAQLNYQPGFETWRLRNQGLAGALGAGYQAELQNALNQAAPRGGGGDPLEGLLPYLLGGEEAPPVHGGPGQGYQTMDNGDPWTQMY